MRSFRTMFSGRFVLSIGWHEMSGLPWMAA